MAAAGREDARDRVLHGDNGRPAWAQHQRASSYSLDEFATDVVDARPSGGIAWSGTRWGARCSLMDDARGHFDAGMAIRVFRNVAHSPIEVAPPLVPSVVALSDDSPAVLPDSVARALEGVGWIVRRLPGVHHEMQLEAPDRNFEVIADLL